MACSISITSVTGIPAVQGGTITSTIHVTGTLTGECKPTASGAIEIIVEATCGSNSAKAIATPDSLGNWSADITLRCTCGGDIKVTASCATDPTCTDTYAKNLQCEGNCPTGSIGVSVGDCNPDGTRNVILTANITSVPPGTIVGQFDYGDGTVGPAFSIPGPGAFQDPGAPHHYMPPGPPNPVKFLWVLPANCPPLTTMVSGLQTCPLDCPQIVSATAGSPGPCVNGTRTVHLDASLSGGPAQSYHWNFGDTNQVTIFPPTPPAVDHPYAAPGTGVSPYTAIFTVTAFNGACVDSAAVNLSVQGCGGGNGGGGDGGGGGEGGGCKGLRWAGVIAAILAALALYICQCVPVAGSYFCWIALGLAALSAILLGIWYFWCPKPCGAALLIGWQIALGAGIGALYFAPCCPTLWIIGAVLIAAAIAGLFLWIRRCKEAFCQVLAELAVVITVVVIPVLGWIAGIPFLSACLNPIIAAAVSTLSAAIALGLAHCASH